MRGELPPLVLTEPEPPSAVVPVPDDLAQRLARDYGAELGSGVAIRRFPQGAMATAATIPRQAVINMGWRMHLRAQRFRQAEIRRARQ